MCKIMQVCECTGQCTVITPRIVFTNNSWYLRKLMTITAKSNLHQGHVPSKQMSVHAFHCPYLHLLCKKWSHLDMKRTLCYLALRILADCHESLEWAWKINRKMGLHIAIATDLISSLHRAIAENPPIPALLNKHYNAETQSCVPVTSNGPD